VASYDVANIWMYMFGKLKHPTRRTIRQIL